MKEMENRTVKEGGQDYKHRAWGRSLGWYTLSRSSLWEWSHKSVWDKLAQTTHTFALASCPGRYCTIVKEDVTVVGKGHVGSLSYSLNFLWIYNDLKHWKHTQIFNSAGIDFCQWFDVGNYFPFFLWINNDSQHHFLKSFSFLMDFFFGGVY